MQTNLLVQTCCLGLRFLPELKSGSWKPSKRLRPTQQVRVTHREKPTVANRRYIESGARAKIRNCVFANLYKARSPSAHLPPPSPTDLSPQSS
jgi:hypothetical protein